MKKTAKGIVVILAAVMFVLCFSTQGSAKVNNRAKKLTKEFTNYAAYMAVYKGGTTKNFSSSSARKQVCAQNERYCNGDSLKKVSKRLFGKSTPYSAATIGEWGADFPYLSGFKMSKTGRNKYVIKAKIMNECELGYTEQWGNLKLYVKKSSKSSYGYVATKLVVKGM